MNTPAPSANLLVHGYEVVIGFETPCAAVYCLENI